MEQTIPTMEQESPEESTIRYMLPEQVKKEETSGSGLVDYTLNEHSSAKTPITTKKRKKSQKKKKSKQGKTVKYHAKVITKTFYKKLNSTLEEIVYFKEQ